jgi:single-strand DNA-binding protein
MFSEVTVIGHLGGDATPGKADNGSDYVRFNVAANKRWTDEAGQAHERTTWFSCTVWGNYGLALKPYLLKGKQVWLRGDLVPDKQTGRPRLWQSKQSGNWHADYEVRIDELRLLGKAPERAAETEDAPAPVEESAVVVNGHNQAPVF